MPSRPLGGCSGVFPLLTDLNGAVTSVGAQFVSVTRVPILADSCQLFAAVTSGGSPVSPRCSVYKMHFCIVLGVLGGSGRFLHVEFVIFMGG